jgi:adenylylsulfate kinase
MSTHVVWHSHNVTRAEHEQLNGHAGCVLWFTGLSGSGKSSVANLVERKLYERQVHTFLLDGDNVRHGLNATPEILAPYGETFAARFGLTFAPLDRRENIRRVGAVAELFAAAGIITLTAFISPYRADRDAVRQQIQEHGQVGDFVEIFVDTPLAICEQRDPKGLYKKARAGEIRQFTGIDDPYEPPTQPELRLDGGSGQSAQALADEVLAYLQKSGKIIQQR